MELKPCPFCGNEPRSFEGNLGWHIGCNNPYCDFQPSENYNSERVAVWQWNKRDDKADLNKLAEWFRKKDLNLADLDEGEQRLGYYHAYRKLDELLEVE